MHARQLAQIATSFSTIGHLLNRPEVKAVGDSAHGYWLANRFRFDAWHQRISQHRAAIDRCGTSRRTRLWHDILPTLEEILISESLTRVVAYLSAVLEKRHADADWSALSHSVLFSHIEARHRCLNLMVFGYGLPVERAVGLNRLRRAVEFFTDQMISALPPGEPLERYAHDVNLTTHQQRQFVRYPFRMALDRLRLHSLLMALEHSIQLDHRPVAAHPRLNQNIAESTLGILPPEVFDSFGVVRSRAGFVTSQIQKDTEVKTDNFEHPLQSPFDILQAPVRIPESKSRRR